MPEEMVILENMKAIRNIEWAVHLALVLLGLFLLNYPAFDLTFGVFNSGDGSLLWPSIIGSIFNLILFYAIAFYLIPVTLKQGVSPFVAWLSLLFVAVSTVEILIDAAFYLSTESTIDREVWSELILMVFVTHILVVILAFAYRFSRDWFANEQLKRSISEHQLRSELEVLKSQINPHFLFNALNNLFSMALQSGDERTAEGINKLSEMMRYVFDKTGADRVALKEEVDYIRDYIYLQQLRFEEQVTVQFTYPEKLMNVYLAPMLLIPFVENSFKYGVSTQFKTTISIRILIKGESFIFEIENQKVERPETVPSSGVGLKNVRKRLNLVYPGRHELTIVEDKDRFKVKLVILRL